MERITASGRAISGQPRRFARVASRFIVTALLFSAGISMSLPGSTHAEVGLQSSYTAVTFSAGANPSAAKIADLDNDGLNDIAVVNLQGSLQLFFNNGAGSFQRISLNGLWPSTANTLDVDIGDLNGDGRKDIAVAFSTQTGAVSVLLNQGNRAFASPVNYNVCNSSRGVAIGDLDLDGDNDLADIGQCSRAGVLLNNGQGGFGFNGTYGAGASSRSIALGDFNRDGFKDIVYVNRVAAGSATVIYNNRNGAFGPPESHYAGDLPDDVTVDDFDGDGTPDLAIANAYFSQIILLFNDDPAGGFLGYSELTAVDTPTSITSGDFNGDGRSDIAAVSWGTAWLTVFMNQGNYNFAAQYFNVGQHPADVDAADLDGDSLHDMVVVNQGSGNIMVFLSAGGAPPPPPPLTLALSTRLTNKARFVDLNWSGAAGARFVDIYRDGSRIATVTNTGRYSDQLNRRAAGTFRYKVCVEGGNQCSSEATISF
ncbi:MAG TPA: VCBS repeat-containing protein [Blastocatellia bacterium]|nr:VCBS repeat-containing protein [Blastocatellia bacterium]